MSKTLIAYFSVSGNTKALAGMLGTMMSADVFEIRPEVPYTAADVRYTNPLARCNKEKIGKKDVPIKNKVENFGDYELILIGFPIWYFTAPNIISTFVKSYDFTGKKVALFATSGGSDITKAPDTLQPLMKGEIIGAKLFPADANRPEIASWLSSLK